MATTKRRERRGRAQWQRLLERAGRSPLSIAAFCRAEDVSTASFYSWRKRLGAPTPGASVAEPSAEDGTFLELGVLGNEAAGPSPWDIELELGAGMVLRLRRR
jgi:transposase-like protein